MCPRQCPDACAAPAAAGCEAPAEMNRETIGEYYSCLQQSCNDASDAFVAGLGGAATTCTAAYAMVGNNCDFDLASRNELQPVGTTVGHMCPGQCPNSCAAPE